MTKIVVAEGGAYLDDVAQIWAEATAARDGDPDVASLADARPVLQRVLDLPRSLLLVALDGEHRPIGFAAAAAIDESSAELHYIGVRPADWGGGVADGLMSALEAKLSADGVSRLELLVYVDNPRAVALYERRGWHPVGQPQPHPRTGKHEQRYGLNLT